MKYFYNILSSEVSDVWKRGLGLYPARKIRKMKPTHEFSVLNRKTQSELEMSNYYC